MTFHPPPNPGETIKIRGKIVYTGGPWGTDRPVRNATVKYFLHERNSPANLGAGSSGIELATTETGPTGSFFLEASAPTVLQTNVLVEDVLEVQDATTKEWDVMPLDGVVWGRPDRQNVGNLKVIWDPPSKVLAWVDSRPYKDIRNLAFKLFQLLKRSPDWPAFALRTSIRLQREDDGLRDAFDSVRDLFRELMKGNQSRFASKIVSELDGMPLLRSQEDSVEGSLTDYLKVLSQMDIKKMEHDDLFVKMLIGIWKARDWSPDGFSGGHDSGPDAAAACVLIYCAARMVIDEARVVVTFSSRTVNGAGRQRKYKIFDVWVGR